FAFQLTTRKETITLSCADRTAPKARCGTATSKYLEGTTMNVLERSAGAGFLTAALLASAAALPALAADVTPERLLNAAAEPQNWLMVHHTYDAHRYSALDMINRDNVASLRP